MRAQWGMHRRLLIAALGCWPATRLLAQDEASRPRQKVSAGAIWKAMSARFPVSFAFPGLLDLRIDARRLLLLPERQRLGAALAARVTDLSTGRVYPGDLDLTFALRFERSDQTLRARNLEVSGLRSPALPPEAAESWQDLLDELARSAMAEVILHRFTPGELALPEAMGFQPEKVTVENDGVEIGFGPKPLQ